MVKNERGSTLVLVLILILLFSVIGTSLMIGTVSERKRVDKFESQTQARVHAQTGLMYFEEKFRKFLNGKDTFSSKEIFDFLNKINDEPDPNLPEGVTLELNWETDYEFSVTSRGIEDGSSNEITGHYRINFDLDSASAKISKFPKDGTQTLDVSNISLLDVGLLNVLTLDLLSFPGEDNKYYLLPNDGGIGGDFIRAGLLGLKIITVPTFNKYEDNRYIASRRGSLLGANISLIVDDFLKVLNIDLDLLNVEKYEETNILINGYTQSFSVLGLVLDILDNLLDFLLGGLISLKSESEDYSDIVFKKLAILGNVIIQQDRDGMNNITSKKDRDNRRKFIFKEGLYVKESLVIGGPQDIAGKPEKYSDFIRLMLRGNMLAEEGVTISYVDLLVGDTDEPSDPFNDEEYMTNIYTEGDVEIKNANIKIKENSDYNFGVFSEGTMTITDEISKDKKGNVLEGVYYAQKGIFINTGDRPLTVKGGLIGPVTVNGQKVDFSKMKSENGPYKVGNLIYEPDPKFHLKLKNVDFYMKDSPDA